MDEKKDVERVELSGGDYKEDILDSKDNLIISDETRCRDDCLSPSLCSEYSYNSIMEDVAKHQGMSKYVICDITKISDQTQIENMTNDSDIITKSKDTENGVFEVIDFLEHIQSYNGKMYSCNHCDFSSSQLRYLKVHKESKHEGVRYRCDQCDFSASYLRNLKEHKKSKHEGVIYR